MLQDNVQKHPYLYKQLMKVEVKLLKLDRVLQLMEAFLGEK